MPPRASRAHRRNYRLDPSEFLRKDHRKRNADLVKLFMTVDHQHVTFTHFLHDEDKVISDEAVRVFLDANKKKFRPGEDFKSLERMIERLDSWAVPSRSSLQRLSGGTTRSGGSTRLAAWPATTWKTNDGQGRIRGCAPSFQGLGALQTGTVGARAGAVSGTAWLDLDALQRLLALRLLAHLLHLP